MGRAATLLTQSHDCAALILAGGRSTRMGQDKALLIHHGKPLIAQACTAALGCTPNVSVFTPWPDRYRRYLPQQISLMREVQPNTEARGPLVALAQALTAMPAGPTGQMPTWLLLLACDWVGLSGPTLQSGYQQLAGLSPDVCAYLPTGPKGWEPLHGFYRVAPLQQTLPEAITQGMRAFQTWLDMITVEPWPLDTTQLVNCNTPRDWQQAQASP